MKLTHVSAIDLLSLLVRFNVVTHEVRDRMSDDVVLAWRRQLSIHGRQL